MKFEADDPRRRTLIQMLAAGMLGGVSTASTDLLAQIQPGEDGLIEIATDTPDARNSSSVAIVMLDSVPHLRARYGRAFVPDSDCRMFLTRDAVFPHGASEAEIGEVVEQSGHLVRWWRDEMRVER